MLLAVVTKSLSLLQSICCHSIVSVAFTQGLLTTFQLQMKEAKDHASCQSTLQNQHHEARGRWIIWDVGLGRLVCYMTNFQGGSPKVGGSGMPSHLTHKKNTSQSVPMISEQYNY